ncbi:MAG: CotH kinase family protein [Armatimonas sp.]
MIPMLIAPAEAGFYAPTKVHTIQLKLTQEEWDSMTPTRSGGGPGGGGPGGPGGGPMNGNEFPEIKSTVTIDGKEYVVGLRFKGNSSYMSSSRGMKRPFKIDLNQFVKDQTISGLTKINLNNNFSDRTQIRETLAYEIFRRMGVPSPKTSLAKVTLNLEGEDKVLGLYTLAEQLDTNFLKERFGTSEGMLLKPEGARGGIGYLGDSWNRYEKAYDPKGKPKTAEKERFIAFAKLVTQADDATFQKEISSYLDIDSFAKFLAATVVTSNGDSLLSMGHNFYIWLNPKTNKFHYLPWDLNMAFGGFPIGDAVKLSVKKPYAGESKLLDRFLALPEGRAAYEKACRDGAKILTELNTLHDQVAAAAKPIAALDPKEAMGFGPPQGGPGGGGFPGGPDGQGGFPGGPPQGGQGGFGGPPPGGGFGGSGGFQGGPGGFGPPQGGGFPGGPGGGFPGGPGGGGRRGGGPGGPGGMGGTTDLKKFFAQRSASILAQLDGKEEGVTPQGGGPGGGGFPGGPGGPGGFRPGGFGGPPPDFGGGF